MTLPNWSISARDFTVVLPIRVGAGSCREQQPKTDQSDGVMLEVKVYALPCMTDERSKERTTSMAIRQTTAERQRLDSDGAAWRRWGPYVSARDWGTVREDYSADGYAWDYFQHDNVHSRCYR